MAYAWREKDIPDPHNGKAKELFVSLCKRRPYVYKHTNSVYVED